MTANLAKLACLLTALALAAATPCVADDNTTFYHDFEAEAFDNVPSYGNWHPAAGTGWYIKEHVHASSQGIGICDAHNVGAEMFKTLTEPLPAGTVKAYCRVYAMRGGSENAFEVALGNGTGEAFQPVAAYQARWGAGPRGYFWLGEPLKLDKPCRTIRLKALQAGRTGIGDNPEQEYGVIWFDRIYLSNDPDVTLKETRTGGQLVKPPAAQAVQQPSAAHKAAQSWLEKNTPSELPKPPAKGNLLFNAGFELGFEPWWFTPDRSTGPKAFHLAHEDLSAEAARHGKYGLAAKLEQLHSGYAGILARRPFLVRGGTQYVLTFWARTTGPAATANVSLYRPGGKKYTTAAYADPWTGGWKAVGKGRVELDGEWKRHAVTIATQPGQQVAYFEVLLGSKEPCTVHLDSFMVCAQADAPYAQRRPLEAAIHSRKLGRTHYNNTPLQMVLAASHERGVASNVTVAYEIVDLAGEVVHRGHETITVRGAGTFEKTLALPFQRRGAYIFRSRARRGAGWQQFAFNVIEPPLPPEKRLAEPFITTIGNLSEPNCAVHAAGGYDGFCTLEGGAFMPIIGPQRLKEDGSIDFADADVARARKHGLALIGYIVPWTWGRYAKHEWIPTHRVDLTGSVTLALDAYADYVRRTLEHFPKVRWWILEDEADMHWGVASEFAPWVKRLHAVAKKANPDATIMFSMMPQMFEELAETIGPEHNDGVGGSFHGNDPWFHCRIRDLIDRYDKKYAIDIGVGWTCPPTPCLLDRWNGFRPARATRVANTAFRVTSDLIRQQAIVNYTHQSRYTSHLNWVHNWSFGMDDSWHAGSAAFVNILQFLRGAKRGGMLDLSASGVRAYHFTKDGVLHVALIPTAWFDTTRVTLPLKPTQVDVLDRDVNPVKLDGKKVTLTFEPNHLYILRPAKGTDGKAVLTAVRGLTAERVVWARTMALPATGGGLDYAVYVRNDSGEEMDGVLRATHGNLRNPADRMRRLTIPAGSGKLVRFPLAEMFGGDRSFGLVLDSFDYTDGRTFHRANEGGWKSARGMWIAKSLPAAGERAVTLDGKLDEWTSQSGAYVYLSWAQDGSYGRRQGVRDAQKVDNDADASATVRVRHDEKNLYLAVDVRDDRLVGPTPKRHIGLPVGPQDSLTILLDTKLQEDIDSGVADRDDFAVLVTPTTHPQARLRAGGLHLRPPSYRHDPWGVGPRAADTKPLDCQLVSRKDGWSAEVAIPWAMLGGRFDVAGFNVELHDVDDPHAEPSRDAPQGPTAILRWCGSDARADDPRSWGQLIVRPAE